MVLNDIEFVLYHWERLSEKNKERLREFGIYPGAEKFSL